jgi:isocitrate lyase
MKTHVAALGAITGSQAVQMVRAGLKAIDVSGRQVAGDGNLADSTYPDQSLYPGEQRAVRDPPLNNVLVRADQIQWAEGEDMVDWLAPIVADARAGFAEPLNAFELMKSMIDAGAAGVHFEGPALLREEVRPSRRQGARADGAVQSYAPGGQARGDVYGVPSLLVARNRCAVGDAVDDRRRRSGSRAHDRRANSRGLLTRPRRARAGDRAGALAYALYCDLIWCETSTPDSTRRSSSRTGFMPSTTASCSPTTARVVQRAPQPGRGPDRRHRRSRRRVRMQEYEFELERDGLTATRHQREVGGGYFDLVAQAVSGGESSTPALGGSTEEARFETECAAPEQAEAIA